MSSNKTANYQLNQWEPQDQVLRADFNADNAKLDAALKALADTDAALGQSMARLGNCQMELSTYVGTGAYGSGSDTTITFAHTPEFYMIYGDAVLVMGCYGVPRPVMIASDVISGPFMEAADVTWTGNTMSMVNLVDARYQLNDKDTVYWVLGLRRKK